MNYDEQDHVRTSWVSHKSSGIEVVGLLSNQVEIEEEFLQLICSEREKKINWPCGNEVAHLFGHNIII